jgi:hypothetical protein
LQTGVIASYKTTKSNYIPDYTLKVLQKTKVITKIGNESALHLPDHNYLGPGTNIFGRVYNNVLPVDVDDGLALIHDIEYLQSGKKHTTNIDFDSIKQAYTLGKDHNNLLIAGLVAKQALPESGLWSKIFNFRGKENPLIYTQTLNMLNQGPVREKLEQLNILPTMIPVSDVSKPII